MKSEDAEALVMVNVMLNKFTLMPLYDLLSIDDTTFFESMDTGISIKTAYSFTKTVHPICRSSLLIGSDDFV